MVQPPNPPPVMREPRRPERRGRSRRGCRVRGMTRGRGRGARHARQPCLRPPRRRSPDRIAATNSRTRSFSVTTCVAVMLVGREPGSGDGGGGCVAEGSQAHGRRGRFAGGTTRRTRLRRGRTPELVTRSDARSGGGSAGSIELSRQSMSKAWPRPQTGELVHQAAGDTGVLVLGGTAELREVDGRERDVPERRARCRCDLDSGGGTEACGEEHIGCDGQVCAVPRRRLRASTAGPAA